jgi:hypothetical protein
MDLPTTSKTNESELLEARRATRPTTHCRRRSYRAWRALDRFVERGSFACGSGRFGLAAEI